MAPLEAGQVNREGDENAYMKCDPKQNAGRHRPQPFHVEAKVAIRISQTLVERWMIRRQVRLFLAHRHVSSEVSVPMWNFAGSGRLMRRFLVASDEERPAWGRRILLVVLTLILSLLLVQFPTSPVSGLDSSWSMSLLYFHQQGLEFGRDVIFTYGPLGFLLAPTYFGHVPLIRAIWETFGNLALAATLVGVGGGFAWFRFGLYYISLVAALLIAPAASSHFTVPLLVIFWLLPATATPFQAAVSIIWIIFFSLVKFNFAVYGLIGVAAATILALLRRQWYRAWIVPLAYALGFLLLWIISGQSLAGLPRYLRGSWEIADGYLNAMATNDLPRATWLVLGLAWLPVIGYGFDLLRRRKLQRPQTLWLPLYIALLWFLLWKYCATRADEFHLLGALSSIMVVAAAIPASLGDRIALLDLLVPLCIIGVWTVKSTVVRDMPHQFVLRLGTSFKDLLRPQHRARVFAEQQRLDHNLHAHPELRRIVGTDSIDMISCEQVELLREGLNYRPRPVFQSYTAYTPWLLQQNLHYYESRAGPQYVFVRLQPIDSRYAALEDGPLLSELPRRYSVVHREKDYVLLQRKGVQPEHEQTRRLLTRRRATLGQEIPLPPEGDCAIELRARFQPSIRGRVRSFLVQPALLSMVLTDAKNQQHPCRIVPQLSASGFVIHPLLRSNQDFDDFVEGRAHHLVPFHSLRDAGRLEAKLVRDRTRILAIA